MLDERLMTVCRYIQGHTLLDVGSDHAYLPIEAIRAGRVQNAICGEVVKGPYESTVNNIRREDMADRIEARFGSGLEVVFPDDDIDTITICGMGGPLIADILETGFKRVRSSPRLVLQANTYTYPIRKTLVSLGYEIIDETVIRDGRHFYEIIVAEPGSPHYDVQALKYGPILLDRRPTAFIEKLKRELEHQENILSNMRKHSGNTRRMNEVIETINSLKEVLGK